ncbi:MAG: hypothetical protein JNK82_44620 [Myxococcaceae bacterium]|nr:hypothetical protein [Myxococcaceae bacterium]
MRLAFAVVLFAAAAVRAQPLTVSVMDVQGQSEATVRRVHKAAVEQLKAVVAAPVESTYDWKGPKKGCAPSDTGCQRERLKGSGVALWLSGGKDRLVVSVAFVLDGERAGSPREAELDADAPDLKAQLEASVPAWLKKGWGAVKLSEEPPPGSVLKLDGRVASTKRGEPVAVPAGPHQLDLVYPDGRAVLQRIDVGEGTRTRVEVARPGSMSLTGTASSGGFSGVRLASYAVWMVGAATVLSAFIVGFVGRQTGAGQNPCRPDTRECVTLGEATEQQRRAAGYASIANVLLGTGLILSLGGAGLFTYDVLR